MKISEIDKLRTIDGTEKMICLFSGGKDCGMALARVCKFRKPVMLMHFVNNNISSNHNQDIKVVQQQAKAMEIPLTIVSCNMRSKQYAYMLARKMKEYGKMGINSLVVGTLYDTHAYNLYSSICRNAFMELKSPLWGLTDKELLSILEEEGIQSIITTINDKRIPSHWLGKVYDLSAYNEFKKIGIHPFGEYNEFHTTLVDASFFEKKLYVKQIKECKYQLSLELSLE